MKTFTLTAEITLYLGDTPPNYFIPPDERLEWINALNSGEYVQGTGELCFIYEGIKRFCCLGVKASLETEPTQYAPKWTGAWKDSLISKSGI